MENQLSRRCFLEKAAGGLMAVGGLVAAVSTLTLGGCGTETKTCIEFEPAYATTGSVVSKNYRIPIYLNIEDNFNLRRAYDPTFDLKPRRMLFKSPAQHKTTVDYLDPEGRTECCSDDCGKGMRRVALDDKDVYYRVREGQKVEVIFFNVYEVTKDEKDKELDRKFKRVHIRLVTEQH